jgi:hypothetical protein
MYSRSALVVALTVVVWSPPDARQPQPDRTSVVNAKVLIRNRAGEMLLVFDERREAWEVPGISPEGQATVRNVIDSVAADLGVVVTDRRLGGLFTYHNPTGRTILRPYYTARFERHAVGRALRDPVLRDPVKSRWFSFDEARKAILYPASVRIVEKLTREPRQVWGGAFEEHGYASPMTPQTRVFFRVVEDFYPLR